MSQSSTGQLQDFTINIKLKLSALWITVMFLYAYGDIIGLFQPWRIQEILDGRMGSLGEVTPGGVLLGIAVLMSIPALMVVLSLILKPRLNRWVNVIVGLLFTVIVLLTLMAGPWPFYIYLSLVEVLLTLTIAWQAWKWPRKNVV